MEPIYVRLFALHICENHSEVVALPLGRFALCGDSQSRSWLRLSTNRCLVLLKLSEVHRENRSIGILLLDFSSKNVLDLTCLRSCWPLSSSTTSWHCGTRNFAPDEQWKRCKNGPSPSFFYLPFLSFSILFYPFLSVSLGKSMPALCFQQLGLGNQYTATRIEQFLGGPS